MQFTSVIKYLQHFEERHCELKKKKPLFKDLMSS